MYLNAPLDPLRTLSTWVKSTVQRSTVIIFVIPVVIPTTAPLNRSLPTHPSLLPLFDVQLWNKICVTLGVNLCQGFWLIDIPTEQPDR